MITLGAIKLRPAGLAAFALLICGAAMSNAITPRHSSAHWHSDDLGHLIPQSFAGWTEVKLNNVALPDPAQERLENKLYNFIITRVYQRADGAAVMLVIAYGSDQSDALQLHRPEVCYAASGYDVGPVERLRVLLGKHAVRLARVPTHDAYGYEPVSYWMRVGDRQVTSNLDRQIAKLELGLSGVIPDGVLVRVSTRQLNSDPAKAYALEDGFIADLLSSLGTPTQKLLLGRAA